MASKSIFNDEYINSIIKNEEQEKQESLANLEYVLKNPTKENASKFDEEFYLNERRSLLEKFNKDKYQYLNGDGSLTRKSLNDVLSFYGINDVDEYKMILAVHLDYWSKDVNEVIETEKKNEKLVPINDSLFGSFPVLKYAEKAAPKNADPLIYAISKYDKVIKGVRVKLDDAIKKGEKEGTKFVNEAASYAFAFNREIGCHEELLEDYTKMITANVDKTFFKEHKAYDPETLGGQFEHFFNRFNNLRRIDGAGFSMAIIIENDEGQDMSRFENSIALEKIEFDEAVRKIRKDMQLYYTHG